MSVFLTVLSVIGTASTGVFIMADSFNGFPVVRHSALRLANSFTKYERYKVVSTNSSSHFHHTTRTLACSLILEEGGMLIPVECEVDVYSRIRGLLNLNGPDREVFVKAKIDSKRLKLVSVKGYNVK